MGFILFEIHYHMKFILFFFLVRTEGTISYSKTVPCEASILRVDLLVTRTDIPVKAALAVGKKS